ncbi:efflux transporter outer membrane subunit [Luteibacter sp. UNCMF366Tsu5.1]|uniref:efflux transporter outer membrane subunit n=1 Tax=Luteibacter sp. UNCMF366Tsu5.1 TaxID=1502758 RepID=UPI0009091C2A|nr:efflux transporter outer membrane subunit [Luteibacter sp. UNCMF366Tsu5.1]SFW70137.1 outer membrane protein, multidrug efflux system [Luteibacter sp. UNCMF366Tsu5.1]
MKTILRSTALFTALVLAGCASVGPDYQAPKETPVTLIGVDAAHQDSASFQAQWWKQFGDPTLDALIVRAAKNAPDLKIAVARLAQARAVLGTAKSQQIPDIETGVSYQRSRQQQPGFSDQRQTVTAYQAGFDASWELDLFGGIRRSVEAARADAAAGEASLRDAQVTLFAEVARNYFDLRGTQLRIDVAKRDIANQQDSLKVIAARVDVGTGAEQDLASAKARLAAVEAQLPVLETQASADQFRLAVLLGQRPGELDIDLSPASFKPIDATLAIGGADDVLQRRPDIRIAERELAAANARIGVAKADYFPHISLGGFIGFLAGRSNNFGGPDSRAWSIAPSISWSGLNVQRVRSGVKGAEARADEARANYDRTVLTALEDVDNSLVAFNRQRDRVEKLLVQATESRRAAALAKLRYDAGRTDYLELLDAERTQLAAEDQLAEAEAGINLRAVQLYKALGGGWQACGDEACNEVAKVP